MLFKFEFVKGDAFVIAGFSEQELLMPNFEEFLNESFFLEVSTCNSKI